MGPIDLISDLLADGPFTNTSRRLVQETHLLNGYSERRMDTTAARTFSAQFFGRTDYFGLVSCVVHIHLPATIRVPGHHFYGEFLCDSHDVMESTNFAEYCTI